MSGKGRETRDRILENAIDLFYEHGFHKSSARILSMKLGMTCSSMYNHFRNKDEILFTIIQHAANRVLETLHLTINQYDDPEICLKKMIANLLGLFSVDSMRKEIAIFIDELYQLPEHLREICNDKHREIYNLFKTKINAVQKSRLNSDVSPTVATFGILGATLWVYQWYHDDGKYSVDEIADQINSLLFNGLLNKVK